jgi:hypothetical protein
MSDQPKAPEAGRGVPVWVFVVSLAAVALVAGSLAWLLRGPAPTPVPAAVPTSTISLEPTVPAAAVPTATTPATVTPLPPKNATVKEPALITHMTWSPSKGYRITADYVQILTGQAAADAATAAGEESPPPNDYFILNESAKLRTFALPKTASITVLGWGGADATAKHALSVGQFMDIMPGGANPQEEYVEAYFYVTVKNGTTVTKVEQIFFP